jgi:hypothetical protein
LRSTGLVGVVIACLFVGIATIAVPSLASAATFDTAPFNGLSTPWGIAIDAAGDVFVANDSNNTISVLPESSGRIFGQPVTAGVAVTLTAATGLDEPAALAFDAAGDLFVGNIGNNTITVVPKASGGIFGQPVSANLATTITAATGLSGPFGLAFDAAGDLFVASEGNSAVDVLSESTGTIFGQSVTANTEVQLLAYPTVWGPTSLAFDAAGDLFLANIVTDTITADPASTGSIFGQAVTANVPTALNAASGLTAPWAMAFDAAGDLFVANASGSGYASVIPVSSGTLFGQAVIANTAATFLAGQNGIYYSYGLVFDAAGDLYSANAGNETVTELQAAAPQTVTFTSSDANPTYGSRYTPTAVATSTVSDPLTPTFSIDAGSGAGVCASTSGVVTLTKLGSCVIDASVAGSGGFAPASTTQTLTVTPAPLLIKGSSASMAYGSTVPSISPQITGLENSDSASVLGSITCSTTATSSSIAGNYPTMCTGANDPNYAISYLQGQVTIVATPPGVPIGVNATAGNGSITASWTPPSSNGGSPITAYTLIALPQGGGSPIGQTFFSTATTETLSGLTNGTPYNLSVTAETSASLGGPGDATDNPVTPELSTQTVAFTSTAPTNPALSSTYTLSATGGNSGNPVTFTIGSGTTNSACSIIGDVVTFDHTGTCVIDADQQGGNGYAAAPQVQQSISVGQVMSSVTWASPASIVYGTALDSNELDATASLPGTFTYLPAAGTVLGAGTTQLKVVFTPTSGDYEPSTGSVSLAITKATPTVTWPTPAPITAGVALSTDQLDATASVPGTFTYNPALATVEHAGANTLSVTFAPTDTSDYASVAKTVTLQINKATPTVTWPSPASISYGASLGSSELDATASVPGAFSYQPSSGTVPTAGSVTLSVKFSPTDTSNEMPVTKTVNLVVNKATPILSWSTPTSVSYGTPLDSSELDATASVPGTFSYLPAQGTTPSGGTTTLGATFSPTDATDYSSGSVQTTLVVNQVTPTITWSSPPAITAGAALGSSELDATASVPGTFTYSPAAGTVPSAGTTTLAASFTPTDAVDYTVASQSVSLVVNPATAEASPTTSTTLAPNASTPSLPPPPSGTVDIVFAIQPGIAITAGKVRVHGHDFLPGSTVTIVAHSAPRLLGTAKVGANGTFSDVVRLPPGLPTGAHHIIVSGTLQDGTAVAQEKAFTVATGGVLGTVGSVPPGPLANDVAFVPSAHRATVLATAAGGAVAIGAVASSLGGGFIASGSGGTGGGTSGSGGGGGGGYLEDVELEREDAELAGGSRGDRSRSWRLPGTRWLDRVSALYPSRVAAISPVAGRVLTDGDYLRAIFGSGWLCMGLAAIGLGSFASASTGWYAVPPSLPIFLAILGFSIFDSTLGYLAGLSFFGTALFAGHVTTALELRTGAGVVLLWFAVPLAAAALRPLRRNLTFTLVGLWDRAADLVIGGLFAAWAAEKMTGALSGLAGVELPIAKDVNTIAFAVIGFVGVRILIETIAAHHYPKRLERVKHRGRLESENLQVGLSLIVQIVLFLFISVAFMGSTWGLYVGAAVFFSPLVPWLFADKIPKSKFVTKWKPTGLVNWAIIIVTGVLLSRLLDHLVHDDKLVEMLGFIILPLPILISWALELFETEEEDDEEAAEQAEAGSAETVDGPNGHGVTPLPVLVYAGAGPAGEQSAMQLAHATAAPGPERYLEAESARSIFREGQEARMEAKEHISGATRWKMWSTRIAGVPLVAVSVYLVVTHIAGG